MYSRIIVLFVTLILIGATCREYVVTEERREAGKAKAKLVKIETGIKDVDVRIKKAKASGNMKQLEKLLWEKDTKINTLISECKDAVSALEATELDLNETKKKLSEIAADNNFFVKIKVWLIRFALGGGIILVLVIGAKVAVAVTGAGSFLALFRKKK